jgi:hypothetical protein
MKAAQFCSMATVSILAAVGCGSDSSSSSRHSPTLPFVINEALPANKATCANEQGAYADWVELYLLESTES